MNRGYRLEDIRNAAEGGLHRLNLLGIIDFNSLVANGTDTFCLDGLKTLEFMRFPTKDGSLDYGLVVLGRGDIFPREILQARINPQRNYSVVFLNAEELLPGYDGLEIKGFNTRQHRAFQPGDFSHVMAELQRLRRFGV
jgi:hypothetical protein